MCIGPRYKASIHWYLMSGPGFRNKRWAIRCFIDLVLSSKCLVNVE